MALGALVTACGGGGGSGGGSSPPPATTATLTLYVNYDLPLTVMSATAPSSNPFQDGMVTIAGTNSTQIEYTATLYTAATQTYHNSILTLTGTFSIPQSSLTAGFVTGATGTVTGVKESYDGLQLFTITGLNADAAKLTNASAAGDYTTFWHLIAGGATNVVGVNGSASSSASLFCGANDTGASINLTTTSQSIQSFLVGC